MSIIAIILLVILIFVVSTFLYVKKVPHGWVEFKTGLILKFTAPLDALPVVQLRHSMEEYVAKNAHKVNVPIKKVQEMTIPTRHGDIEARLYDDGEEMRDRLIVYIHGGGYCICSIDTHNEPTRRLARATSLPVLSINYSLAPEHKFPQALEECMDAVEWVMEHMESLGARGGVVLMGDSAGGNLSISTVIELTKLGKKGKISEIVGIYPAVDATKHKTESYKKFGDGYYLTKKAMNAFTSAYMRDESDLEDPRFSPILVEELEQFPPTFILTAAFDPLRDEGEHFARNLEKAGVPVKVKRYKNAVHGFFGLKDFGKRGLEAVEDIAQFLELRRATS